MDSSIRFLHTADLHIGRPFTGICELDSLWRERIVNATRSAFDTLCDYAIKNKVDFVLVSGDVFDTVSAEYSSYALFFDGLKRLSHEGIHTYICAGNHDPYSSWKPSFFSESAFIHIMETKQPSYFVHYRNGQPLCYIAGRSYKTNAWDSIEPIINGLTYQEIKQNACAASSECVMCIEENIPAIALVHTSLNKGESQRYAPLKITQLQASGVSYWALGHIHAFECFSNDHGVFAAFPGCLQGGDIGECGDKGFVDVTMPYPQYVPHVTFVPASPLCWEECTLDVTHCETLDAVQQCVEDTCTCSLSQYKSDYLVARVCLTGITPLYKELNSLATRKALREEINRHMAGVLVFELVNKTILEKGDVLAPSHDTFLYYLVQKADALADTPDDVRSTLKAWCEDKDDATIFTSYLDSCSDKELKELISAAKDQVVRNLLYPA